MRPLTRTLPTGLALGASVLALAACGSSSSSSASTSSAAAPGVAGGANTQAFAKYTACLKAQGVTLGGFGGRRRRGTSTNGPPPTGTNAQPPTGPNGTPPAGANGARRFGRTLTAKQRKAMQTCAKLRPKFNGGGNGGPGGYGGPGAGNGAPGAPGVAPQGTSTSSSTSTT